MNWWLEAYPSQNTCELGSLSEIQMVTCTMFALMQQVGSSCNLQIFSSWFHTHISFLYTVYLHIIQWRMTMLIYLPSGTWSTWRRSLLISFGKYYDGDSLAEGIITEASDNMSSWNPRLKVFGHARFNHDDCLELIIMIIINPMKNLQEESSTVNIFTLSLQAWLFSNIDQMLSPNLHKELKSLFSLRCKVF